MTNKEIWEIAMRQSAIDSNCHADDFKSHSNVVAISSVHEDARKYLGLPFYCDLVSYGNNVVASVNENIESFVKKYIDTYSAAHCFETPNMHVLNDELEKFDMRICFMADYFLPDVDVLKPLPSDYEIRLLKPDDFSKYYVPQWSNALCEKRKHLDVLAVGAFAENELVGLAACSADGETMWQIGIDVLPDYRKKGIAATLTSRLAIEILQLGIVPFYCTAWSNIKSVRNAIKSGFKPAWVEMTAKSKEFVAKMNSDFYK